MRASSDGTARRVSARGGRDISVYKRAWRVFLGLRSKESREGMGGERVCVTLVPGKAEGCRINRLHA